MKKSVLSCLLKTCIEILPPPPPANPPPPVALIVPVPVLHLADDKISCAATYIISSSNLKLHRKIENGTQ